MEGIRKSFNPVGEIEIWKQYADGEMELHYEDHNVITSGLGLGFAYLYAGSGAVTTIENFQITNFQVGAKGSFDDYGSSTNGLAGPLSGNSYAGGELVLEEGNILKSTAVTTDDAGDLFKFVRIPYSNIHKITPTSVRYTLVVDQNSCNNLQHSNSTNMLLNEVGLFMRNPNGFEIPARLIAAYRPFSPIYKTNNFALIFKWTLRF